MLAAAGPVVPLLVLAVPRRVPYAAATPAAAHDSLWRAARWPVCALLAVGVLAALASALDTGPTAARDAALVIGAPALRVLLPLATAWLVVAVGSCLLRRHPDG